MKIFSYRVKDKQGKMLKGFLEAESQEQVIDRFRQQECIIFSVSETKKKEIKGVIRGRVTSEDLVLFSRQFTTLIESSVPVVEALSILKDQVEKASFKDVIGGVLRDVKEGNSLAAALSKHPRAFPEIYISMVEAAEISGNLSDILQRVSIYLEKDNALRKKVVSALYYPVIIVLMAGAITSFLMIKVIPTFKSIFDTLGGTLPLPTRILIFISDFVSRKEVFAGAVVFFIGAGFLFKKIISTDKGKRSFHYLLLKLPVFGDLVRKIAIAKFSRTFATLVKSGVSIVKCLEIVAKTSGNKIVEDAVLESRTVIQQGETISVPLEKTKVFPTMVVKMIYIGEKSGRLEEMLSKVAQFYEEQTDALISGLSSLIEPVIIVFLGVVVGGIVVSLFLPIIKISQYLSA